MSEKYPFQVVSFNAVYAAKPKLEDEYCAICQDSLTTVPFDAPMIADECYTRIGECGHYFHSNCLNRSKAKSCPMCRRVWKTKNEINLIRCVNIGVDK
jgi:hypothetical protein